MKNAIWMLVAATALVGCGDDDEQQSTQQVSVTFAAKVGAQDFACGTTYENLGTAGTSLELVDFRFYVADVELRNESGDWVEVALDDNDFQIGTTTLLDFEDGCGEFGNPQQNDSVTGTVPTGTYDAVRFSMGVPDDINHLNNAVQPPPMNLTDMFWAWESGYKFLRIDSGTFAGGGWRMHLGSTACTGDPVSGETVTCGSPNRVSVELEGFEPGTSTVIADARALVAGQDLDNLEPMPPGCMSGPNDPDCTAIFANLGLPFMDQPGNDQSFFYVE